MASFVAVRDPDRERRARFLRDVGDRLAPVEGLRHGSLDHGFLGVRWAASSSAPVSVFRSDARAGVLWGDAYLGDSTERASADDMVEAWTRLEEAPVAAGFHACVVSSADGCLLAGGDVVGLFPIYYWGAAGDLVVLTSNADLVRHHPAFTGGPSLEGIAGVLLTGGIVDGRSILNGVRRLGAGHVLRWTPGVEPDEVEQYVTPTSRRGFDEPVALTAERLDAVLRAAVRRHVRPARRHALLLSGGRDSRLLAGYLRDQRTDVDILTLGKPDDFEVVHSQAVVRALGGTRTVADVPQEGYGRLASTHVRAEQTHGSLAGMHNWGVGDLLGPGSEAVVVGHLLELATGRPGAAWAGLDSPRGGIRDSMWQVLGIRAVPRTRLGEMIRCGALSDAVEAVAGSIDGRSDSLGSLEDAARDHVLRRWVRAHPGTVLWRLSFRAWPIAPVLDPAVLEAGAACAAFAEREIHDHVLRIRHPVMARAPLVRPDGTFDPVIPSARWRLSGLVRRCRTRLGSERGGPQFHRHRYRRIYDLDNEGWRGVRALAEPGRSYLLDWFDAAELARYVPPAADSVSLSSPIDE